MFAVMYQNGNEKEATRAAQITSISWAGLDGNVDGIEGDPRLSGRILTFDSSVPEKVLLRPGKDGRTTVSGEARMKTTSGSAATPQTVATTDDFGVAVVTGRHLRRLPVIQGGVQLLGAGSTRIGRPGWSPPRA